MDGAWNQHALDLTTCTCTEPNCLWALQAVSSGAGAGVLQKLGRVLREKAATDLDRILNGASKTREKLGVWHAAAQPVQPRNLNRS